MKKYLPLLILLLWMPTGILLVSLTALSEYSLIHSEAHNNFGKGLLAFMWPLIFPIDLANVIIQNAGEFIPLFNKEV